MHSTLVALGAVLGAVAAETPTYACNPAHAYPNGAQCVSTKGSLTLVTPAMSPASAMPTQDESCGVKYDACRVAPNANMAACASEYAGCLGYNPLTSNGMSTMMSAPSATATKSGSSCDAKYDAYRTAPDANMAFCASEYAGCLGYNPFTGSGMSTSKAPVVDYTTKVVTAFTTYCPQPTTMVYNNQTHVVSSATTLTLCPHNCTMTHPVRTSRPVPTTRASMNTTRTPVMPTGPTYKPLTTTRASMNTTRTPVMPTAPTYNPMTNFTVVHTTKSVSQLTTYCPHPTTLTYGNQTYPVPSPTSMTIQVTVPVTRSATVQMPPGTGMTVRPTTYYSTGIISSFTTSCPKPTTITHGGMTYPVTSPGIVTIPATTYSVPVSTGMTTVMTGGPSQPAAAATATATTSYKTRVVPPTTMVVSSPTMLTHAGRTYPVYSPTTMTFPATNMSVPVSSAYAVPSGNGGKPSASRPVAYQGAAGQIGCSAVAVMGVAGLAALAVF